MMSAEDKSYGLARVSLNAWICQDHGRPSIHSMTPLFYFTQGQFYLRYNDLDRFTSKLYGTAIVDINQNGQSGATISLLTRKINERKTNKHRSDPALQQAQPESKDR
jgi:hypothetical protein